MGAHEQLSFADLLDPASEERQRSEADPPDEPQSSPGQAYAALLEQYRGVLRSADALFREFRRHERAEVKHFAESDWQTFPVPAILSEARCAMHAIRTKLVGLARTRFVPQGVALEIEQQDIDRLFPLDERFDPCAIWQYLEQTYGGQAGERLAWQRVAERLRKEFGLCDESQELKRRGGYVLLERKIWIDDFEKKFGKIRLSYGCGEAAWSRLKVLSEFAVWAQRPELARDALESAKHWRGVSSEIESRKRYEMGKEAELVMVTYQTKFEYLLRADVAEDLQIFLGTYAEQQ